LFVFIEIYRADEMIGDDRQREERIHKHPDAEMRVEEGEDEHQNHSDGIIEEEARAEGFEIKEDFQSGNHEEDKSEIGEVQKDDGQPFVPNSLEIGQTRCDASKREADKIKEKIFFLPFEREHQKQDCIGKGDQSRRYHHGPVIHISILPMVVPNPEITGILRYYIYTIFG
jgi:hypothetical protein